MQTTQQPKVMGYHALASLMGPIAGMAQFKQFAKLNAHSLLMQQAECLHLEHKLKAYAMIDHEQGLDYECNVGKMLAAFEVGASDEQWQLILKIRSKLESYNNALLHQFQLHDLPGPGNFDAATLRNWLSRSQGGDTFLFGIEYAPWLLDEQDDLVNVSIDPLDTMTRWAVEKVLPWFGIKASSFGWHGKASIPGHDDTAFVHWREDCLRAAFRAFVACMSMLIPSVAILILYFIQSMIGRIMTAMALSLLFSTLLSLSTTARAAEVFAATTAFAAVQVVFIGSANIRDSSTS